ncbi:MAG: GatB/YqeY domain-containing protein [Polyangiaceae bacterium]|jgi:uncharacterized protein
MLSDEIKKRANLAAKAGDTLTRDILRVALGEIQTVEHRVNKPLSDDEAIAIVRKLVKSNEETLAAVGEGDKAVTLRRENEILASLLPKSLSVPQIVEALATQIDAIKGAKNDGQATGIAMKHLKTSGAAVDGTEVAAAVKQIRG